MKKNHTIIIIIKEYLQTFNLYNFLGLLEARHCCIKVHGIATNACVKFVNIIEICDSWTENLQMTRNSKCLISSVRSECCLMRPDLLGPGSIYSHESLIEM